MKTVLLGGTGLVGGAVLQASSPLIAASRRAIVGIPAHHSVLVSADLAKVDWPEDIDQVICCLGTTLKKAGSKEAFREQDLDLARTLFEKALSRGAKRLLLVSALGAAADSRILYSRVKGELEAAVAAQNWQQVVVYQPSLLLGDRSNDPRPTEFWSQKLGKLIAPAIPALWRPIEARVLAGRILKNSLLPLGEGFTRVQGSALWK